jgi:alkyl hydroperoxide reductase subunit AhpF
MLDANIQAQLKSYLERVTQPIELIGSLDDRAESVQMRTLIEQIAALSDQVTARFDGEAPRRPSFRISRVGADMGVEFAALPMGHEFTSLVLALLQAGGHPPKVEPEVIEQIQALEGDFVFETYMSLTCHNCPDVVQALNLMAVLNPRVKPRGDRRRPVPGRGRTSARSWPCPGLPERPALRLGPHGARRDPGQGRHRCSRARRGQAQCQGRRTTC